MNPLDLLKRVTTLPQQISAIGGMNPQQSQDYRAQVNTILPKIPVQPPAVLPTPSPNSLIYNVLEKMSGFQPGAQHTVSAAINPIQTGAEGLARLPAARTFGEGFGDVADVVAGILGGANQLHGARSLVNAGLQNPSLVTNERGGMQNPNWKQQYKQNISKPQTVAEKMAAVKKAPAEGPMKGSVEDLQVSHEGWQNPGDRQKFDLAVMNGDANTIKAMMNAKQTPGMIGDVPEKYMESGMGEQAYKKLIIAAQDHLIETYGPDKAWKMVMHANEINPAIRNAPAINMPDPATRLLSDEIPRADSLKTIINWFYK